MKKVLILSNSPRKNYNSDLLCREVLKGGEEAGAQVEMIRTSDYDINPCLACNTCKRTGGTCAIKDDVAFIQEKMVDADVIIMATPLYYYTLSAQIKMVIDRCYCLSKKEDGNPIENKEWYLLISAETKVKPDLELCVEGFKGFLRCVSGSILKGVLYATGTSIDGPANSQPYFGEAKKMGAEAAK